MNKSDLINAIAKEAEVTKVQAGTALDTVLTAIEKSLKKGDSVILVGFGTFSTAERKARTGRNPATGKAIKIPKRRVVRFKAGKGLADAVKK
ncbi:MAG: HU family DNA-binding protein [Saprospiraceae bacterium]|nr:HU family DNA-binding protein [Saprospiraceae bacterium]